MASDAVHGMRVEMLAIACLTVIVLLGMFLKQNEIAAAAVGGIAGFISQKSLSNANRSDGTNQPPAPEDNSSPKVIDDEDTA